MGQQPATGAAGGRDLDGKVAAQCGVDLLIKHAHTAACAELANGEFRRCASYPRQLSTAVCIEGDGVGHEFEGSGDFTEDNNGVQPCSGTGDAAIRSTSQVVGNDYNGDRHKQISAGSRRVGATAGGEPTQPAQDRKSTRLNS